MCPVAVFSFLLFNYSDKHGCISVLLKKIKCTKSRGNTDNAAKGFTFSSSWNLTPHPQATNLFSSVLLCSLPELVGLLSHMAPT